MPMPSWRKTKTDVVVTELVASTSRRYRFKQSEKPLTSGAFHLVRAGFEPGTSSPACLQTLRRGGASGRILNGKAQESFSSELGPVLGPSEAGLDRRAAFTDRRLAQRSLVERA